MAFRGGDGLSMTLTQDRIPMFGLLLVRLIRPQLIWVSIIYMSSRTPIGVFDDVNFVLDSVGVGGILVAIDGNEMSWCQKVSESCLCRQLRVALTQFLLTSFASYESWFLVNLSSNLLIMFN